jgi:hypothetical protein
MSSNFGMSLLRTIQWFTLSPGGALILQTGDQRTITARRR